MATDGDEIATRRLLSPLINIGGVSQTPDERIAPKAVLERLQARRILKRVRVEHGDVPVYVLTSRYQAARRAIVSALPDRRSAQRP